MARRSDRRAVLAMTVILIGVPRVALACPVCFGASESPMAAGVNAGIYVLLAVTSVVLSGLGLVALRVARSQSAAGPGEPEGPRPERGVELSTVTSPGPAGPVVRLTNTETAAGARRTC